MVPGIGSSYQTRFPPRVLFRPLRSGFVTTFNGKGFCRITYRDGKQQGERKCIEDGKPRLIEWYENGERVWRKMFRPSGALESYSRKLGASTAQVEWREDGTVWAMRCLPEAKGDSELQKVCGFEKEVTISIYDSAGKVSRVQTWKDGMLQKESPGTSEMGSHREVSFKDGKEHGEERVFSRQGKLASTVSWDGGIKDGKEMVYAEDGKKIVKEMFWKAGKLTQMNEFYLNGNPKLKESYDGPTKQSQHFWDTGAIRRAGVFVMCLPAGYGGWCEDGVHRFEFENGTPEREISFRLGRREGTSKSWWENGKPTSVESFADDKLIAAKRWDKEGRLVSDDEFEADGSRKLRR